MQQGWQGDSNLIDSYATILVSRHSKYAYASTVFTHRRHSDLRHVANVALVVAPLEPAGRRHQGVDQHQAVDAVWKLQNDPLLVRLVATGPALSSSLCCFLHL